MYWKHATVDAGGWLILAGVCACGRGLLATSTSVPTISNDVNRSINKSPPKRAWTGHLQVTL